VIGSFISLFYIQKIKVETPPATGTTVYADNIIYPDGVSHNFVELNAYRYEIDGGINDLRVIEMRLNAYTDTDLTYAQGYGVQWIDRNKNWKFGEHHVGLYTSGANKGETYDFWEIESNEIYYYQTDYSGSFSPVIDLDRASFRNIPLIFAVKNGNNENEILEARLTGSYDEVFYDHKPWLSTVGNWFKGWVSNESARELYYDERKETVEFTIEDFFSSVMNLTYSSEGYGDFIRSAVNVEKYFHVKILNDNKQFVEISKSDFNTDMNFFNVSVHLDKRAMSSVKQSLFGVVGNNFEFNTSGTGGESPFYRMRVNYDLTLDSFEQIYSITYGGNLLFLKQEIYNYLSMFKNLNINVWLYLSNSNVVGLGSYSLFGLEINSMTVSSSVGRPFNLLEYSLWDTNLQLFTKSSNVTVAPLNNCFNGNMEILTGGN
jgi:hypothetical protein